ncbi:hypothetical protein EST38_g5530 [Candolleomyces aberdarensis]|uniref:Tyrosine specific protein phosphatases domain-containing protein n=1 Tax=Candolleomyces aberdarensis TaxID=2316362 RepID=A0A4Q2DMY8_9AGAR|nr:hypothetical protein EST38_g5530 [Candolleomyces aberdarensis]
MKNDILQEAARYGGVLLTHNEVASGSNGEGAILPTWTAVDVNNVKTSRDLWEHMKNEGWNVDYHHIPVPPDRNIEDNYFDAYLDVIRSTDPTQTSLVFSCGMGAVRTTFAMVAASLVRRKQLIARGMPDPYSIKTADEAVLPRAQALELQKYGRLFAADVCGLAEDSVRDMDPISFLRKASGSKLNVFVPVNDLSSLSKTGLEARALVPGTKNNVAISGDQILGDEYSDHVVKHRSGIILRESMLLKSDQWLRESHHVEHGVRGAINFRQIPDTSHPTSHRIIWITLREEPIVYIGAPYCLRRERFTLRNMKDYGGISASRLEVLEERLRDDVLAELESFGGRLLLHTETPDGAVVLDWGEVHPEDVMVLKDVMGSRRNFRDGVLQYNRVPITAEKPPEHADLQGLIEIVLRAGTNTPIVVNCQLGRGRSTFASIILVLIRQWLQANLAVTPAPTSRPSPLRSNVYGFRARWFRG